MRLGIYGKILHKDRVGIGRGHIDRYTLFEFKYLGGVIFNVFNSIEQDRWHTHAFNSICIQLRGYYYEDTLQKIGNSYIPMQKEQIRAFRIRFLPRTHNHRILESSPNAWSLSIMGPWQKTWTETRWDYRRILYTWGRKRL